MLDEKDLQAIARVMDEKIGASESRVMEKMSEKIIESETRMMKEMTKKISESEARMTEKISESEARTMKEIRASEDRMMKKISESEARTAEKINGAESRMLVMMEAYFEPRFQALGEQMKLLQEKMVPAEALAETEDRVDVLEAVVKQHSREIKELKMAQ